MARRGRRAGADGPSGSDAVPGADVPGDPEQPLGDPETVARTVCLRMLDRRAYSRAELETALARRGVPDDAARRVLDRFAEVGLVDDVGLAAQLAAATHRERGLARRAVAQKLRQRGIADDVAGSAVAVIDSDAERVRAEQLVARRLPALRGLDAPVRARRLVGLLARKGYSSSLAHDVVRAALRAEGEDATADAVSD